MDDRRFDDLTRLLAAGTSRRALVKRALAGLVGGMTALTATRAIGAAASQPNGASCTRSTDCASRVCKDGVCCNGACTGQCEACNLPGLAGACSPVVGNPVNGRPSCPGSGPCKGACTGSNRQACAFPGPAVSCGSGTCAGGFQTTYACGGNGSCAPTTTSCGPYACGATACLTSCTSSAQCVGAAFCANGVCQGDQPLGQACSGPDQCQSGFCVDGVCCLEACTAQCEACNVAGNEGFCTPTPGVTCDDGNLCTVNDVCQNNGRCQGTSKDCSAVDDQCNTGVCRASDGACIKQPRANGTSCSDGNACTSNDTCQNGACVGTPVVCDTPGVCQTTPGTCNPQNGTCSYPVAADNTACGTDRACCAGVCCAAGQECVGNTCQAPVCLELQAVCDSADECCQDGPTACGFAQGGCPAGAGTSSCCRPLFGTCANNCDCCDSNFCLSSQCCRGVFATCASSDQCCSGLCCGGSCCQAGQTCVSGACQTP